MKFTNTDNPITDFNDDKLGFKPLVKRIANSIINSNIDTTNSFTISIEGKWGSGKTSLVNLIKNDIKKNDIEKKVVVMEFNPWIVNDFEQLVEYFFSELLKEIVHESFDAKLEEDIWKDIKKFVAFFTPNRISIGISGTKMTYNLKDILFNKDEQTLLELKSKINGYLEKLNKKIVIIVDDIDRLTDKEIEIFFRLIKGIADFNNIIYLLLYDKAIVAKSLEQFKQEKGERYLDKIVQYSLSIPKVHSYKLKEMLNEQITRILKENPTHIWNIDRWSKLVNILDKYIKNIRDINKVINVISIEYPQIAEDVDFTDFFIISLIKVQKYELYELIRDGKYIFDSKDNILMTKDEKEKKRIEEEENNFYKQILDKFEEHKELFYLLYPHISEKEYYKYYKYLPHTHKMLSSPDYFDNYFTFSVAENSISTKQYYSISSKLSFSDFEIFKKEMLNINTPKQIILFRDMIKEIEFRKTFNEIELKNMTINLLAISSRLDVEDAFLVGFIPFREYLLLSFEVLKKSTNKKEILEDIYFHSKIVILSSKLLLFKEIKKDSSFQDEIDKEILNKIERYLKETISNITIEDLINKKYEELRFYALVDYLQYFGLSIDKITEELNQTIFKSKKYFFLILDLLQTRVYNNGDVYDSISHKKLKSFTKIEKIENYINNELDKSSLTDKELNLLVCWEIG